MPDVLDDRYELVRPLGSGGMGDVFEAFDRRLDRKVAVKILRASVPDPRARDRFANEARVGAKFSHPNAVLVYDAGADGDRLYLVTELVEGRSLADVLAEHGPMDATETVAIIDQVLDALDAAHEHGIVHRDVKPSNVLLTSTGVAKLTDFGIAKASADATAGLTATGQVLGTAKYLSPEQATGEPADARSDLYSTAVMAYEMLAGSAPFTGDTPLAVAAAHANAPVPSLAERRPDLPAPLVAAVERGLEKDPAHRFADAEAMRAALSGGAADEATTLLAAPPVPPTQTLVPAASGSDRRRLPVGLAIAAGALLLIAALAFALTGGGDDGETAAPANSSATTTAASSTTTVAPVTAPALDCAAIEEQLQSLDDQKKALKRTQPDKKQRKALEEDLKTQKKALDKEFKACK